MIAHQVNHYSKIFSYQMHLTFPPPSPRGTEFLVTVYKTSVYRCSYMVAVDARVDCVIFVYVLFSFFLGVKKYMNESHKINYCCR